MHEPAIVQNWPRSENHYSPL